MFLRNMVRGSPSLNTILLSPAEKDRLAVKLLQLDRSFEPPAECTRAQQLKNSPPVSISPTVMYIRSLMAPALAMIGIAVYSYFQLLQKKEDLEEIDLKDYENLTYRQIELKEASLEKEREFRAVLDKLQDKLKDDYQRQIVELQDFVTKKKSS